jgi:hypothetical protein
VNVSFVLQNINVFLYNILSSIRLPSYAFVINAICLVVHLTWRYLKMSSPTSRPQPPPFAGRTPQPPPTLRTQPSDTRTSPTPPAPPTPVDPLPPPRSLSYPDFSTEEAQDNPRKYSGYRVFSRWMASDQAFFILRRFGTLNTRVLLAMQDEIVELEDQLNLLDEEASRKESPYNLDNGTFRDDPFGDRRELVTKILPEKLAKYSKHMQVLEGSTR